MERQGSRSGIVNFNLTLFRTGEHSLLLNLKKFSIVILDALDDYVNYMLSGTERLRFN